MSNHSGDTNKMVGEDHLRDATKMVSDTPRTETYVLNPLPQVVSAEWARQLERELNAANERIKRLEEAGDFMAYNDNVDFDKLVFLWEKAKEAKP
jgi:hypothetical protein